MSVFFNGRLVVSPATVSAVDDSAMRNTNANVGNVLAIVGKATGGKPFTPLAFGSYAEAAAVLRSGEMLKAVQQAFDASAEVAGPATVIAVRVNPASRSTLVLKDSVGLDSILLTSEGYGSFTPQIKVKVETGSLRGKKITVQLGNDYYVSDNTARDAFSIAYVGASANTKVDVTAAALNLIENNAVLVTLSLSDFPTVQALADRISAQPGWAAVVLDASGDQPTVASLDSVSAINVSTAPVTITATVAAIIGWFNSSASPLLAASRASGNVALPANLPFTFATGGSDGAVTLTNWQQAFDALQVADVHWVTPITADPAVHAMTSAHVDFMSNVARKERRAIVGMDIGSTDDGAVAAAKALNSDRMSLVHLGFYDYNSAGALTLFPPYILAAQIAGAFSGANPGTALTNKSLKVRGLERRLRNPTDTDKLILGGVFCVEDTPKGFKVVKSISTWLTNLNYNRVEVSCGVAVDFTQRNVREVLDELRGGPQSPALLAEAVSRTDSVLRILARPIPNGPGVLVGDATNPPFKNIVASLDGDILRVEYQCSPVIPNNYITVVMHAVPFSGTATA